MTRKVTIDQLSCLNVFFFSGRHIFLFFSHLTFFFFFFLLFIFFKKLEQVWTFSRSLPPPRLKSTIQDSPHNWGGGTHVLEIFGIWHFFSWPFICGSMFCFSLSLSTEAKDKIIIKAKKKTSNFLWRRRQGRRGEGCNFWFAPWKFSRKMKKKSKCFFFSHTVN